MQTKAIEEVREVRVGSARLDQTMTQAQARRYGDRNMPCDLRQAGFSTCIFVSDPDINGGLFFRISYGKTVPHA